MSFQVYRYHDSGAGTVGTETKRGDLQKCPLGRRRLGPQTTASPMGGPAEVLLRIRILLGILFVIAGVIVLGDRNAICARCAISTPFAARRSSLGCSPSCATSAVVNSRAAPPAYTTLINTLTAKRTRTRTLSDLCGRSRSSRQKRKCCTSGTHKQSAVSLRSFPTSFGRRSFCAKSTICPIARLPTWSVYRSER